MKTIPKIKKDPDDPQKKTRIGAIVVEKELPRTFFSSKVFALGIKLNRLLELIIVL